MKTALCLVGHSSVDSMCRLGHSYEGLSVLISLKPRKVVVLELAGGKRPFGDWFNRLKDLEAVTAIRVRLARIQVDGHLGSYRSLGEGVFELKFSQGPGYRIYFGIEDDLVVLFLSGGHKGSQDRDIRKAKKLWANHLETKEH